MNTILQNYETIYRDKGSKFIGLLFPCEQEEEFKQQLERIKKNHYNATHHCYAWRINPHKVTEFSNDDGEPSGTAGLPILNQLKSVDLVNVAAVIVRYYGGTKLGKPGLIEAYKESTALLTAKAHIKKVMRVQLYEITYPYCEELSYQKLENDFELIEQEASYTASVRKRIACNIDLADAMEKYHERVKHVGIELKVLDKTFVVR